MFETLITIGLGLFGFGSLVVDSANTDMAKNKALSNGDPYYIDSNNKMRSTETGEICITIGCDYSHNCHHVLLGVKTNRVYYDYTLAKAKKLNEEAKQKGQKFYWKEYTSIQQNGGKPTWMAFDPIVGLPYEKEYITGKGEQYVNGRWEPQPTRLIKTYYKEPKPGEVKYWLEYDHTETVYGDEIKAWDYGCAPVYYK